MGKVPGGRNGFWRWTASGTSAYWQRPFWVLLIFSLGFYAASFFSCPNDHSDLPEFSSLGKDCSNLPPIRTPQDLPTLCDSTEKRGLNVADVNGQRLEQDDPRILNYIRENCDVLLRPPDGKPTRYKAMGVSMGQDRIVRRILNNMTGGFFIECGGYDGVTSSNTLEFERDEGWEGLLIEAGPGELVQLHKYHRNAWISHACVSILDYPHEAMFHPNADSTGRISSVIGGDGEVEKRGGSVAGDVRVQCFPLYSFIAALNRSVVDFLSLDVEGHELQILKTIPFHKVLIKVLAVEIVTSREGQSPFRDFMESKGFKTLGVFYDGKMPFDLIFVHNSVPVNPSVMELLQPKAHGRFFNRLH